MLRQYFKFAFRNIVRQKGFALINIAGLAVGLAFALLVLFWVRYEYSVDRHYENLDQIYLVAFSSGGSNFQGGYTVPAIGPYLRDTYPEIIHATRYSHAPQISFEYENEQYVADGHFVDPDFFTIFSPDFLVGSPEGAFENPLSLVITKRMAERIFGEDDALGKTLGVNQRVALTVSAVIDNQPPSSRFQFDFLLSCAIDPVKFSNWDVKSLRNFVMLTPGADPDLVSDKIKNVYNDHNPGTYPNDQYLFPLKDLYLNGLNGDGRIVYVRMFSIMAIIVLLIACINFMNLSTARAATRHREIGLKKVLGAGRGQLVWQFLIEAGIITLAATLIALVLVEALLPWLNLIAGTQVALDFTWDILGLLLAITIATTLLAGGYPALYLSSLRPINILRGIVTPFAKRDSGRGKRFRQALVVLQFAASIALVLGILGIFGQMKYISTMDVGFNKDHLIIFRIPGKIVSQTAVLKNELLRNPDIENVTVSNFSLIYWQSSVGIYWEGKDPANTFDVGRNWVDYDYADAFEIDMVEGRFFSTEFSSDRNDAIVINEACVKAMGIDDPVGRSITIAPGSSIESKGTVIGVIRDHHTESAHTEIRPFLLRLTERGNHMCVRVAPGKIRSSIRFMDKTISEMLPESSVNFRFYDEMTASLYEDEALTGEVVIHVTVIAIFISCLGLFGLASFTARQRAREICIRRVLGASVANVMGMLTKEFLVLVIVAGVIASPVAWYLIDRWLEGFAFRMTMGPGMFLSATVIACILGLITVAGQAYRAATRNPAETLRHE